MVPDDQLSLAIGRRGQNVRLASQLTGWDIDILTEAEESERRQKEFVERTNAFMNALDVDEVVGQLLASEGFRSVEELAFVEPSRTRRRSKASTRIRRRKSRPAPATIWRGSRPSRTRAARSSASPTNCARSTASPPPMLVKFGENEVKTVEDLAGCATDDLIGWSERKDGETVKHAGFLDGLDVSRDEAEAMIMAARVKAGWIEAEAPAAEEETAVEG